MKNKIIFVVLILLIFGLLWRVFIPFSPRVANDFPLISDATLKESFGVPQIWLSRGADGLGQYAAIILWGWLLNFISSGLSKLGFSFTVVEQIVLIIPSLFLGAFSLNKILDKYKIKNQGKFISILFFLTNTYFLLLIDGGQISIALTYSVFPLIFLTFVNSLGGNFKSKILASLGVIILGFLDIRFVYMMGILIFIYLLYNLFEKRDKSMVLGNFIKSGLFIGLFYIAVNVYWLVALVFVRSNLVSSAYSTSVRDFTNLFNSFSLLQPHWYKNVFGNLSNLKPEFLLIPLLVFFAPIVRKKNKTVGFWLVVAVSSVFLTKGTSAPLGQIYTFLYDHIPGFSLFRDSTKFFFLVCLSYSILLGISVNAISKKIKFLPLILVIYFLFLISPVYEGKMTGILAKPAHQSQFLNLSQKLENDNEFGRVLWIPSIPPLGYSDPNHLAVEAVRLALLRPFAIGIVGSYEIDNYLREEPFVDELLNISGIKYLVYPYPDTRRENLNTDNINYYYTFLKQISKLPWVKSVTDFGFRDSPLPVLETSKHMDHFFIATNTWLVLGSDRLYWELSKIPGFNFSNNAFIFLQEDAQLSRLIGSLANAKVLIYGKNKIDLALSFIGKGSFIFPAKTLGQNPDKNGWWKRQGTDLIGWRSFLQEKYQIDNLDFDYGGGWAIAEGQLNLDIPASKPESEILVARVMKSSKGGEVKFYQGQYLIGLVNTLVEKPKMVTLQLTGGDGQKNKYSNYEESNFEWVEIGRINPKLGRVTISTNGKINVVNALVFISHKDWSNSLRLSDKITNEKKVIFWDSLSGEERKDMFSGSLSPKISYIKISPTHYQVNISKLGASAMLAFSESYHPNWVLGSSTSVPLYSLINGFPIEKDGIYDVQFEPQKYVFPGFIFSASVFLILILALIFLNRKN